MVNLKIVIISILLFNVLQIQSSDLCNGQPNLCNRPYNKIAQINVHNATSTLKPGFFFNVINNPVADQQWNLQEQLNNGLRMFKIPVHPIGSDNIPWSTHTLQDREIDEVVNNMVQQLPFFARSYAKSIISCGLKKYLWEIDSSNIRFLDILNQIKNFLDNNPREIITLELNTFDMDKMKDQFLNTFKVSGLNSYIYTGNPDNGWPTAGDMIANNQRLVIFVDDYIDEQGFLYSKQYITSNNYSFKSLEELNADNSGKARNSNANILFNMSHTITGKFSGSPSLANQANNYTVLMNHIQKSFNNINRYPNFISIDFVDINLNDIKRIINELNNLQWPG